MKRIKYKYLSSVVNGEQHFIVIDSPYSEEELAKAYNGEYEVYEVPDPEVPADEPTIWEELDKAYQEGVDSV